MYDWCACGDKDLFLTRGESHQRQGVPCRSHGASAAGLTPGAADASEFRGPSLGLSLLRLTVFSI